MSNSFIWNDVTGKREPIEDRTAFLDDLHRKNAEAEAAAAVSPAVEAAPAAAEAAVAEVPVGPVDKPEAPKPQRKA